MGLFRTSSCDAALHHAALTAPSLTHWRISLGSHSFPCLLGKASLCLSNPWEIWRSSGCSTADGLKPPFPNKLGISHQTAWEPSWKLHRQPRRHSMATVLGGKPALKQRPWGSLRTRSCVFLLGHRLGQPLLSVDQFVFTHGQHPAVYVFHSPGEEAFPEAARSFPRPIELPVGNPPLPQPKPKASGRHPHIPALSRGTRELSPL